MLINFDTIIRFSFLAALFLYPFNFFSHTLYLLPQMIMLAAMVLKAIHIRKSYAFQSSSINLSVIAVACVALPFFSEGISNDFAFFFPVKLMLNIFTLLGVFFSGAELVNPRDLPIIKKFALFYLSICLFLYLFSTNTFSIVVTIGGFIKSNKSSLLYNIAAPLDQCFLTKNIAAMYMASLFAYCLFLGSAYQIKIKWQSFLLFGLLILSFFSRQGVIAFVALTCLYFYLNSGFKKKIAYLSFFGSILVLFFLLFFNLESRGDGSNERIRLYHHFLQNLDQFFWFGLGTAELPLFIQSGGIHTDNYHFFLMNQIALYGIFHSLLFNIFLAWIFFPIPKYYRKNAFLLAACYLLNVFFQTFGFEFQNLWLFMILAAISIKCEQPLQLSRSFDGQSYAHQLL